MKIKVAAIQMSFSKDRASNIQRVIEKCREAAKVGANIILPSELFETEYFCKLEAEEFFALAKEEKDHPTLNDFQALSEDLGVVIPVSFFEKDKQSYYNSVVVVDCGKRLGLYRKSHIPDGPGYEEKYYFRPGNTGFKVWETSFGKIGVGICWDQWFPECARSMVLQGADILFYPTAIGSEPEAPSLDTKDPWQRAMIGHAVSNAVPVVAANRIGNEDGQIFYGHSFISDHQGSKLAEASRDQDQILYADLDLQAVQEYRAAFGFFRDRRPELYEDLTAVFQDTSSDSEEASK